ncbi:MAG TPA: pitrilysin family protein [Longimicrobiaceae bacterium]|nr:pitrilysin family protein [Longimicrobiaceae bacterium]
MEARLKQLDLRHESETLANGLRVVVHEDHTSPIVAVHMMYEAGSRDEHVGRTGLAHLLEHLLFEGSQNCPKGEFDRLLERVGGSNNGSTWLDRTNYYEVVPSHAVELALWLERERMAHFLPILDGEMLEVQRSIVMNERKQVYENRPYGMAHEKLQELLFPAGHPYSWPTIGYMADLEQMTLSDARNFYRTFYAPNNAVLVLAGDVRPEEGFRWANRYFGDVAAGPDRPARNGTGACAPGGDRLRAATLADRVSFPRIYHAYAVPGYGTREWVALDVLSYLLADGESSRLQRTLIRDREIAQDVDTYLYPTQLAGIFGIVSTARSGVDGERLIAAIDEVVDRLLDEGVSAEEVAGAVRRARRDQLNGLSNVEDRAEELAYATTVLGSPARLAEVLNTYSEVTGEEIRELASRYLSRESRATVVVVPEEEGSDGA